MQFSKYKDVAELQKRALSLGHLIGTETKALEQNTEKAWEEKVKQGSLIKTATDIFSAPLPVTPAPTPTDSDAIPF